MNKRIRKKKDLREFRQWFLAASFTVAPGDENTFWDQWLDFLEKHDLAGGGSTDEFLVERCRCRPCMARRKRNRWSSELVQADRAAVDVWLAACPLVSSFKTSGPTQLDFDF